MSAGAGGKAGAMPAARTADGETARVLLLGFVVRGLGPVLLALVLGAVILVASGRNPWATYALLAQSAFGGSAALANTATAMTPIILTGLATGLAFRAGVFNVGIEGSLYVGAFAASWVGFTLTHLPPIFAPIVAMAAAAAAGCLWLVVPALLKAFLDVDEVVSTLMWNYVAIALTAYLVLYHYLASGLGNAQSPMVTTNAQLPPLVPGSQLTVAFPLGIVLLAAYALWFRFTRLGFELRTVGHNAAFARVAGMSLARAVLVAMLVGGAVGGLAGGAVALGVNYRFIAGFSSSPGFGYTGIAVAVLGQNDAAGMLAAAVLFGALASGGAVVQLFANVPITLTEVLQGILMIFTGIQVAHDVGPRFLRASRSRAAPAALAPAGAGAAETLPREGG